jgi:hypothetical protein
VTKVHSIEAVGAQWSDLIDEVQRLRDLRRIDYQPSV